MSISKYLIKALLIFVFTASVLSVIFIKYFPFFFHATVYYCQQMVNSVDFRLLPKNINFGVLSFIGILLFFFIIRLVVTFSRFFNLHNKLQKQIIDQPSSLDVLLKKHNLQNVMNVIKKADPVAFCFGFIKSKIYISTGLISIVSNSELEAILIHEKYHLDRRDNLKLLIANIIQDIFPFLPVLKDVIYQYRIERELAADHAAVIADPEGKIYIAKAIRKLLTYQPEKMPMMISAIASIDTLEVRIRKLSSGKVIMPRISTFNIGISLISTLLLLVIAATPIHAIEIHQNGKNAVMACVRDEQCAAWCKENIDQMPTTKSTVIPSNQRFSSL